MNKSRFLKGCKYDLQRQPANPISSQKTDILSLFCPRATTQRHLSKPTMPIQCMSWLLPLPSAKRMSSLCMHHFRYQRSRAMLPSFTTGVIGCGCGAICRAGTWGISFQRQTRCREFCMGLLRQARGEKKLWEFSPPSAQRS